MIISTEYFRFMYHGNRLKQSVALNRAEHIFRKEKKNKFNWLIIIKLFRLLLQLEIGLQSTLF